MLNGAAAGEHPTAEHIRALAEHLSEQALTAEDETAWSGKIVEATRQWPQRLRAA